MVNLQTTLKRLSLAVGILLLGTLVACGGGGGGGVTVGDTGGGGVAVAGGGGSGAAPGDGGATTPTAVEIPALDTVSDLPYITGVVAGGSFSVSSLKSVRANKAITTAGDPLFSMSVDTTFGNGQSIAACETRNNLNTVVFESATFDIQTCRTVHNVLAAQSASATLYDGNDHVFEYTYSMHPWELADVGLLDKIKLRFVKNSAGGLVIAEQFGCTNGVQTFYERHDIDGLNVNILARSTLPSRIADTGYDPSHIRYVELSGSVNASDTSTYSGPKTFSVVRINGSTDADIDVVQDQSSILFNSYAAEQYYNVGLYADAQLYNPSATLDYTLGSGAGVINIPDYGIVNETECWDGTSLMPIECLANNRYYQAVAGQIPKTSFRTVSSFPVNESWDCSGIPEGSYPGDAGSSCDVFAPETVYGNWACALSTGRTPAETPDFTVSVNAVGGANPDLSEDGSDTEVATDAAIQLHFGKAAFSGSLNESSNIALYDTTGSCDWETLITLDYSDLSTDGKTLTLTPALEAGHHYLLAINPDGPSSTTGDHIPTAGHYLQNHVSPGSSEVGADGLAPAIFDHIVYKFSTPGAPAENCTIGDDPILFVTALHPSIAESGHTVVAPVTILPPLGVSTADAYCNSNLPDGVTGVFKALLADAVNRRACSIANCGSDGINEHINWVLQPGATYRRPDGTVIVTTSANGIFNFPLQNILTLDFIRTPLEDAWTGIKTDWTVGSSCELWSSTAVSATGTSWRLSHIGDDENPISYDIGSECDASKHIVCVQVDNSNSTYTIGGTISGARSGVVKLQNNGGDEISIATTDTTFAFPTPLGFFASYNVTISEALSDPLCVVTHGSDTVSGNATSITVTCTPPVLPKTIFVTSAAWSPSGGISGADSYCNANKPGGVTGTYKAMLADELNRRACTTANCSGGDSEHRDWVLTSGVEYRTVEGDTIGTTNNKGLFDFPLAHPLTNGVSEPLSHAWTGLNQNWTTYSAMTCNQWTSNLSGNYMGGSGIVYYSDDPSLTETAYLLKVGDGLYCNDSAHLICVEQP